MQLCSLPMVLQKARYTDPHSPIPPILHTLVLQPSFSQQLCSSSICVRAYSPPSLRDRQVQRRCPLSSLQIAALCSETWETAKSSFLLVRQDTFHSFLVSHAYLPHRHEWDSYRRATKPSNHGLHCSCCCTDNEHIVYSRCPTK